MTFLDEKMFPIFHAGAWWDEFAVDARLSGDGALGAGGLAGARARALGEVLGELGMPHSGGLCNCTPGGHSFLDRATPIITLVRLHWSPLR
jgi:hypothetical protein